MAPRKSRDAAVEKALAAADAANPVQGAVKQPLSRGHAEEIAALTVRAMNGQAGNAYYTLPDSIDSLFPF